MGSSDHQIGRISNLEMRNFIEAFCEGLLSSPESIANAHGHQMQKVASLKNLTQLKAGDSLSTSKTDENPSSRRRTTTLPALDRMTILLPFDNSDGGGLGWDEYQEIKLIFYSANFKGRESISLDELKERWLYLI